MLCVEALLIIRYTTVTLINLEPSFMPIFDLFSQLIIPIGIMEVFLHTKLFIILKICIGFAPNLMQSIVYCILSMKDVICYIIQTFKKDICTITVEPEL